MPSGNEGPSMTIRARKQISAGANGVGAFILQCKRMHLNYCDFGGSSQGMRTFISRLLPAFAAKHPQIEFVVSPRPNHHPQVVGHYINGGVKPVCVRKLDEQQIMKKVELVRDANGEKLRKVNKAVTSTTPSVRGVWSPYHGDGMEI